MILWLLAVAVAIVAGVYALAANARAYVARTDVRFPPTGRVIDTDGVRLHVREAGPEGASRMLLIHGASSNLLELWGPLAEEFSPLHRVIAYDRPGMGHSGRARREAHTMAAQARAAARVLEQTGQGPAIIVAHSLGAGVALRLALDFPHLVSGLVLVGISAPRHGP